MPSWDSTEYLKFSSERTQPAIDLAARIALAAPRRIIDLGCGPGNSTAVVARRWPGAALVGLDSSPAMIAAAQKDYPEHAWLQGDIATWTTPTPFDLVFSNAALQWVPDHARTIPQLFAQVAPGGAFAFQVPANFDAAPHRLMRELGGSTAWRAHFAPPPREWHVYPPEYYYDLLAPHAARLELWTTDYVHILDGVDGIVIWYRGTGLRPWLDALPDDGTRARFLAEYRAALAPHFPPQPDGKVLFPFRRLFVIAYRSSGSSV
jgi:trans-aconitate 2-methyltransferase